ncbi:class I SAM-dependent methyltransferase [Burkholderia perseverans]|uniref:class I SAM-dependent methyltransferase n=1 Tax=Burkholderia perseverans TaxID=2615214 RepID=UPI001FED3378|nr:class I SAM-dependent methyltransferase [Burkholderia perseverans]
MFESTLNARDEATVVAGIGRMSYPDLVACIGQDNTPPGADLTLQTWIGNAGIGRSSLLLDLACSTGFSSRFCFEQVGSRSEGIDLSDAAIQVAAQKASAMGASDALNYQVADAAQLLFDDGVFSHILGGCNFAFISDRAAALRECVRVLEPSGALCVANFFYRKAPGNDMLSAVHDAIGFRPDPQWTLDYWRDFFGSSGLTCSFEKIEQLASLPMQRLQAGIEQYVDRENPFTRRLSEKVRGAFSSRMSSVRSVLNQQRDFQGVAIQTWRKK